MSGPRYIPSSFAARPAMFGYYQSINWVPEPELAQTRIWWQAAQTQHRLAFAVRKSLDQDGESIAAFSARVGISDTRFARVLRGAVIMRLEDLAIAQLFLTSTEIGIELRTYA